MCNIWNKCMKVKITGKIIELTMQLKKDVLFTHFFPLSFFDMENLRRANRKYFTRLNIRKESNKYTYFLNKH